MEIKMITKSFTVSAFENYSDRKVNSLHWSLGEKVNICRGRLKQDIRGQQSGQDQLTDIYPELITRRWLTQVVYKMMRRLECLDTAQCEICRLPRLFRSLKGPSNRRGKRIRGSENYSHKSPISWKSGLGDLESFLPKSSVYSGQIGAPHIGQPRGSIAQFVTLRGSFRTEPMNNSWSQIHF